MQSVVKVPGLLPLEQTKLVGRDRDRQAVQELFVNQVRLLTLLGTGGIGKTRLARAVTSDLAQAYKDGAQFIDLGTLINPEALTDTLITSLGISRQPATAQASNLEKLRHYLSTRQLLLTLDNFEQLVSAAPLLAELLGSCPELRILVTSRIPLHLRWEQRYPLAPLALPEHKATLERVRESHAAILFAERARQVIPSFDINTNNYAAIAQLCQRLDGLPLALELAAARTNLFTLESLIAYLNDKNGLPGRADHDRPERHHSLENTIGASFELLSLNEQTLFCQLSVFAGSFDTKAAAAVAGRDTLTDGELTEDLLLLSEHSLLQVVHEGSEVRFRLLETIRAFAANQLTANLAAGHSARTRHARHYAALVRQLTEQHVNNQAECFARLDLELHNVRLALDFLLSSPEYAELGAQLASNLISYFLIRNLLSEERSYLKRALGAKLPDCTRAWLLFSLARIAFELADFETAEPLFREALELSKNLQGDWVGAACANELGLIASKRGDRLTARRYFKEAVVAYESVGQSSASPLINLGTLFLNEGDFTEAARYYEQVITVTRQGSQYSLLKGLHNLGNLKRLTGEYELAKHYFHEAITLTDKLGDTFSNVRLQGLLADVALSEKNLAEAKLRLLNVLDLRPLEHNPVLNEELCYFLARFALVSGHLDLAAELYGAYLKEQRSSGVALNKVGMQLSSDLETALTILEESKRQILIAKGAGRSLAESLALGKEMLGSFQLLPDTPPHSVDTNLSKREVEVLEYLAGGLSNKGIAKQLGVSPNTVKYYVTSLFNKLGVNTRAQAVAKATKAKPTKVNAQT